MIRGVEAEKTNMSVLDLDAIMRPQERHVDGNKNLLRDQSFSVA
jgi:hypothetical protein